MILIGVTLAVLVVLVIAGCFLVRRWKKQEIENRRKKAQKAAHNKTMSMDDLILAMDGQPEAQAEPEKSRPVAKAGAVMSEAQAEKWAEEMKAALKSLSESLKQVSDLRDAWGSLVNAHDSARCNLYPAGGEPDLVENSESFFGAVDRFLERQATLFQSQHDLVAFPATLTAPLDKVASSRKEIARLLKQVQRLPEKQLPRNVLVLRIAAKLFLSRKEKTLSHASKMASYVNGLVSKQKSDFYKQTFGPASPKLDEAEMELLACLEAVFSAGKNLKEAEESFRTLDRKRERANDSINRLQTTRLETGDNAVDLWLSELQEAYVEFFESSDELKLKHVPDLEVALKTWQAALGLLNELLIRLSKLKQPTARFYARLQVALGWYACWNIYRVSFTKHDGQERPSEASPVVASAVAAFVGQARVVGSIRAELFTLSEQASECVQALKDLQGDGSLPELGGITDRHAFRAQLEDLSKKASSALLAQVKVERAAHKFCGQVIAFEKAITDARALLEKLRARKPDMRGVVGTSAPASFSVPDEASIQSCADMAAMMDKMLMTWKSNAAEYQAVPQTVERPLARSAEVASLVESIELALLQIHGRKAGLDGLLGEVRRSWAQVEISRRFSNDCPYYLQEDGQRVLHDLPEKPTEIEVSRYLAEVRQWASMVRALELAADQARQRFGEELGLLLQDISDLQSLLLEAASLEGPLHLDDEAMLAVLRRYSSEHVSGIADNYVSEEADWCHRTLPLAASLPVGEDLHGYGSGEEVVACFTGEPDKVELITLEELRKRERSLVFALVQSAQAQSKLQSVRSRLAEPADLGKPPAVADVSEETCDFNSLIDDLVAYRQKVAAVEQMQLSLNQACEKASQACDERDVTVANRQSSVEELLSKLRQASYFGACQSALDWTDEFAAAKGICQAGIWRRRTLGY